MNLVSCSSCGRQFDILSRGWGFSHCSTHAGIEPIPEGAERDNWRSRFSGPTRRENFGELSDSDTAF